MIKDMFGIQICVGDIVLKPIKLGNSPFIEKRFVSSISGDRLYLDDSKVPINYPNRLVVFSKATTQ